MPRKTQNDLNLKMREAGRLRARTSLEKSLRLGRADMTPAGSAMVRRTIAPLTAAITAFVAEATAGKAGRRHTAALPLASVDPALCAYLTVQYALNGAMKRSYVQTVARAIGRAIDGELGAARFERDHPAHFNYIVKNERERNRPDRQIMQSILVAEQKYDNDPARWTSETCLHVGLKLVELAETTLGVFATEHIRSKRTAQSYILTLTPGADEWFKKLNENVVLNSPLYLPTIEPPIAWTAPVGGGVSSHFIRPVKLVKLRSKAQREALDNADLTKVYEAVNTVQNTPWQVNRRVLAAMHAVWQAPAQFPVVPQKQPAVLPDMPDHIKLLDPQSPDRLAFRRERRAAHIANHNGQAARLDWVRLLAYADDFADEDRIYFPHVLDFRGRLYPLSSVLTPQGDDAQKALLHFADGKALGERGLYWLGVHGANVYGNDKVTLDDRYEWAKGHVNAAASVALDPLTDLSWLEADKPWQYLAWCFEWAFAMLSDDPAAFVSHLPIALDGSCNGLQHFAAMLRDPVAGAAVNLVPSDKPQDIYQRVADVVSADLTATPREGKEEVWAANWLAFGIDRKITKRAVMVLPYGGTFASCREYVAEAVAERAGASELFGDDLRPATVFLAQRVWAAMSEVIVSGRGVMAFIQGLARASAKQGKTLTWTTPSGFPVAQHYPDTKARDIETRFHGKTTKWRQHDDLETISASRQALASSPNFVHSLDASALQLTVIEAAKRGVSSFAMIHDSYGTHAAATDTLNAALRDIFVSMYEGPCPLKALYTQTTKALAEGTELPALPKKGELDLNAVRNSPYFFA